MSKDSKTADILLGFSMAGEIAGKQDESVLFLRTSEELMGHREFSAEDYDETARLLDIEAAEADEPFRRRYLLRVADEVRRHRRESTRGRFHAVRQHYRQRARNGPIELGV